MCNLTSEGRGYSRNFELSKICKIYNVGHNILRLFDVFPNFSFTTSETNRDY